jgi:large subunit ribosomal protein L13
LVKQQPPKELFVIDAAGSLVGRIATQAAREALHGRKVRVVNCEKAVISGTKRFLVHEWMRRFRQGVPKKGPFLHRRPDRIVRRIIRGMLPYHNPRGREAFESTMCYIGIPVELKEAKLVRYAEAGADTLPTGRYMTIADLSKEIGGTWHE